MSIPGKIHFYGFGMLSAQLYCRYKFETFQEDSSYTPDTAEFIHV